MNAKQLEIFEKTIENRTLLRIWGDDLSNCPDSDMLLSQIIDDMMIYSMRVEQLFEGVVCETGNYFIKQLIARCVVKMDTDEDLELSDFGHMFIINTLYKKLEHNIEYKTTDWFDTIRIEMENIRRG